MPASEKELREILGRFATGVTVVTTRNEQGEGVGVTVNSFASVSLDPPLVLWSLRMSAAIYPAFAAADYYAVNILDSESAAESVRRSSRNHHVLDEDRYEWSVRNLPLMADVLATLECKISRRIEGGDHMIMLGEVLEVHPGHDGDPLLYFKGAYRHLSPQVISEDQIEHED
jgi:flavin reductase (DIM6/NTAB) family NADH-FMN oxidoreductase RutF